MQLIKNSARAASVGALSAGLVFASLLIAPAAHAAEITIPDEAFKACINEQLGQAPDAEITTAQAANITELECGGAQITDVTGIDHLTALTHLDLENNQVEDLAPLTELTAPLEQLNLKRNGLGDANIAPLAQVEFSAGSTLRLDQNSLTDISALTGISNISILGLDSNKITSLPADLGGLKSINRLFVSHNKINDLEPLRGLTGNPYWLGLNNNQISDLSPLAAINVTGNFGAANQTINLSALPVGQPVNNPVIGLDGSPVSLDDLYDDVTNTFTPAVEGPTTVRWKVSDVFPSAGEPNEFSGEVTFTAVPSPIAPTITSDALPDGQVGEQYNFTVTADGDAPFTFTADGLPAGLTIDPATGEITGTPTTAGTATVTITASNDAGEDEASYPIEISPVDEDVPPIFEATIGEITHAQCEVSIPVTTSGVGSFSLTVFDNGQVFEVFEWTTEDSPATEVSTWVVAPEFLENTDAAGFRVEHEGKVLDSLNPSEIPASLVLQCADQAAQEEEPGEEQQSDTSPQSGSSTEAGQLPKTGVAPDSMALATGAGMLMLIGGATLLARRKV